MAAPQLTLSELAALVGGQFASEPSGGEVVVGVASLGEARPGDVTFYGNPRYLPSLKKSKATVALVPAGFSETVPPVCLFVENPTAAFSALIAHFAPAPVRYEPGVHSTAVVAPDVEIGAGVSIQPYAVIESGVSIGAGSIIGSHCFIGRDAKIGEECELKPRVMVGERCLLGRRVILHTGVVLGGDGFGFELVQGRHQKIPQVGIVELDDDVEVGANTTIDRARFGRTRIGRGTKIDNLVMIAHNVQIGENCIVVAQVGLSGSVRLGNYVVLGGQVGTVGHIEIGDMINVGGKGGLTKNISEPGTYMGNPAEPMHEHQRQRVRIRQLARLYDRVAALEQKAVLDPKTSNEPT